MMRNEAINDLKTLKDFFIEQSDATPLCLDYAIEALERPHGEWIQDNEGEIYCSLCHRYTDDRHDEVTEWEGGVAIALCYPRYCGFCGAEMRERREDGN